MYLWKLRWSSIEGGQYVWEHTECPDVAGMKARVDISVPGYRHIGEYPTMSEAVASVFDVLDYSRSDPDSNWVVMKYVIYGDFIKVIPWGVFLEYEKEKKDDSLGDKALLNYINSEERINGLRQKVIKTDPSLYNESE
jgi:hypothetical protein